MKNANGVTVEVDNECMHKVPTPPPVNGKYKKDGNRGNNREHAPIYIRSGASAD